jgi:sec-independent protein translocase protein TatC
MTGLASHGSPAMPFLDHLEELRWRVIWSRLGLVIGIGAAFILLDIDVIGWLERPILPLLDGRRPVSDVLA